MSVESRDEVKACMFAYDLDVEIASYRRERMRRKKGTNVKTESTVETRLNQRGSREQTVEKNEEKM